jgi:hypothetical protein
VVRSWLGKYWWAAAAVVLIVGVGVAIWLTHRGRQLPPPRARVYTAFSACLLTNDQGIVGPDAAAVWSGMQAASLKTNGKVSYLAVAGEDTEANAATYVNTLAQRQCNMVLAVGTSEVAATNAQAGHFGSTAFVVIGAGGRTASNVKVVPAGAAKDVSGAVQNIVTDAASRFTH